MKNKIKEYWKWFDLYVTHLDVAMLNGITSILMILGLIYISDFWWMWFLLYANIVSGLLNWFLSWKKDEYNRRKGKKNHV